MLSPLRITAIVSVIVNLILMGMMFSQTGQSVPDSQARHTLREIAAALPVEKRPIFEQTIVHAEADTNELQEQIKQARKQSLVILKADAFDKDAYLMQIERINKLRAQVFERMAEAIVEMSSQSTLSERALLADMLRNPPRLQNQ